MITPDSPATEEQFADALLNMRDRSGIARYELDIFQAFADAPRNTLTAEQLAKAIGFSGYEEANLRFGQLAHRIADALQFEPTNCHNDGSPRWWTTLAYADGDQGDEETGHWQWTLRPELLEALKSMKWVKVNAIHP